MNKERTQTEILAAPPRIWLIGSYFQKGRKGRLQALYEIAYTLAVSAMPFWVGGIIQMAQGKGQEYNSWFVAYWSLVVGTFDKGELLIFAVSFISPALWLASHEPEGAKILPHKRPIVMITLFIGITAAALFALIQAQIPIKMNIIFSISVTLSCMAIVTMYLALTYHSFRMPNVDLNEEDFRRPQNNFIDEFNRHRSEK